MKQPTRLPSPLLIALLIFMIAGLAHEAASGEQIRQYATGLNQTFHISLWLLIVPVITGILIAKKVPSLITLFVSAAMAGICALIFQPHLLHEIAGLQTNGLQSAFKGLLITFYGSTGIETGNAALGFKIKKENEKTENLTAG